MLAQDFLITGSIHNTLSGPCIVEGWEGNRVRVIYPCGYRPLMRPDKLLNGTVLNYGTLPEPARSQLQESGEYRLLASFYSGEMVAFENLQQVADYAGQHRASAVRVYQCRGYSSIISSIKDILN
ncbi:MAG: hypothetical protein ACRDCE_15515 [Cetobacterium sp.]|uniref:hypothetical protein n=1 Tax=Cetobacterium sp. TaxID=2071632 RepID=UPI003EE80590